MSDAVLQLARAVQESSGLALRGLMGYEGHAALERDANERRRLFAAACATLARERDRLISAGFPCEIVSGGSTGTADLAGELGVLTEVQAGSHVLMDSQYADLQLGYKQALFCVATVISARQGQIVVNTGLKSLNGDGPLPDVCALGLRVTRINDEHTIIRSTGGAVQPQVGDRLLLVPSHVDPTVNLHPHMTAIDRAGGLQHWLVDGRR